MWCNFLYSHAALLQKRDGTDIAAGRMTLRKIFSGAWGHLAL